MLIVELRDIWTISFHPEIGWIVEILKPFTECKFPKILIRKCQNILSWYCQLKWKKLTIRMLLIFPQDFSESWLNDTTEYKIWFTFPGCLNQSHSLQTYLIFWNIWRKSWVERYQSMIHSQSVYQSPKYLSGNMTLKKMHLQHTGFLLYIDQIIQTSLGIHER